jgi:hypothetical protein
MLNFLNLFFMLTLYVVIILPLGLLLKLIGKDPLRLKLDETTISYWIKRNPNTLSSELMKKQL